MNGYLRQHREASQARTDGLFARFAGVRLHELEQARLNKALSAAERAAKAGDTEARAKAEAEIDDLLSTAAGERE